jgi:hypothetical protein
VKINYSLQFPTRDAAERAASVLAADGYEVTYDVTWGIDAEASAASGDEVERAREHLQSLAKDLGGDFLGNGGFYKFPSDGR